MTSLDAVTSWRVVCPNFGQDGHTTHVLSKETRNAARAVAVANDRLYRRLAKNGRVYGDLHTYYQSEIGWRVQQTVTEWETVT